MYGVVAGALSVSSPRNVVTTRTFRSTLSSFDSTREFTHEESKQEVMASESRLFTVEAERVPYEKEEGTMMVAEAQRFTLKWYQRPVYRWISVGSILFACGLVVAVVVLVVRPPSDASSSSSLTSPTPVPTTAPTSSKPTDLMSELIACNFLTIPNVTNCRSIDVLFDFSAGDPTIGSTIPSEIGLLTQMVRLDFSEGSLTIR